MPVPVGLQTAVPRSGHVRADTARAVRETEKKSRTQPRDPREEEPGQTKLDLLV